MRMNAETATGNACGNHRLDDGVDLGRLRTAIGVAEHDPAGTRFMRGLSAGERIGGIGLVSIEEMLAIDDRLLAGGDGCLHALGDA